MTHQRKTQALVTPGFETDFQAGQLETCSDHTPPFMENHYLLRRVRLNHRHGISGPVAGLIAALAYGPEVR